MNTNTKKIRASLIAAIDRTSRTIGKEGGGLPWRISEDFQYFKSTTMGHPVIMGRKTWEEFGGKPLPGRHHIVVTRQADYPVSTENQAAVSVCGDIESALELARQIEEKNENTEKEIFVIGGAQIYSAALPYADRLYLTLVDANIDGPAKFPDYEAAGFSKTVSSRKSHDENFEYEFVVLEKSH